MLTSGESVVQMIKVTLKTRVIVQSLILCVGKYSSESSWRWLNSQSKQSNRFLFQFFQVQDLHRLISTCFAYVCMAWTQTAVHSENPMSNF